MALVAANLKNNLLSAFQSMRDDAEFSQKTADACKNYAESGSITTADAGTIAAGVFAGAGTGKIACDASVCKSLGL